MEMMALVIKFLSASKALEYKHELEKDGLVCDKDFTWAYHSAGGKEKSHVEFNFIDPVKETFYRLRWL